MSGPGQTRPPDGWAELEETGLTQDIELPLENLDDEALAAVLGLEEDDGLDDVPD
jgi:hypothetical protein